MNSGKNSNCVYTEIALLLLLSIKSYFCGLSGKELQIRVFQVSINLLRAQRGRADISPRWVIKMYMYTYWGRQESHIKWGGVNIDEIIQCYQSIISIVERSTWQTGETRTFLLMNYMVYKGAALILLASFVNIIII